MAGEDASANANPKASTEASSPAPRCGTATVEHAGDQRAIDRRIAGVTRGRLVEAGENVVSVASYWEVVIKTQNGLLSIGDLATWWRRATELTSARILHIRPSHITELAALPMLHKDPFDRILIAQSETEGLGIVTSDGPIGEYRVQTLW